MSYTDEFIFCVGFYELEFRGFVDEHEFVLVEVQPSGVEIEQHDAEFCDDTMRGSMLFVEKMVEMVVDFFAGGAQSQLHLANKEGFRFWQCEVDQYVLGSFSESVFDAKDLVELAGFVLPGKVLVDLQDLLLGPRTFAAKEVTNGQSKQLEVRLLLPRIHKRLLDRIKPIQYRHNNIHHIALQRLVNILANDQQRSLLLIQKINLLPELRPDLILTHQQNIRHRLPQLILHRPQILLQLHIHRLKLRPQFISILNP